MIDLINQFKYHITKTLINVFIAFEDSEDMGKLAHRNVTLFYVCSSVCVLPLVNVYMCIWACVYLCVHTVDVQLVDQ